MLLGIALPKLLVVFYGLIFVLAAFGELCVAPQTAVGDHDSFREAGRAGRIVQDSQFLRVFDMIFHIVGGERTGIFLAKIFVDAIAYGAYLLIFAIDNGEVVQHHE